MDTNTNKNKVNEKSIGDNLVNTSVTYLNERYNENSSTASEYEKLHFSNKLLAQPEAISEEPELIESPVASGAASIVTAQKKDVISKQWIRVKKFEEENEKKCKESVKEISLINLNEKFEILFWGLISQPLKPSLTHLMRTMIEGNRNPNITVHVGEHSFNCHLIALRAYCKFFREIQISSKHIILPMDKITACGFHMLYNWLLADFPIIQREGIMELLQAATYLGAQELQAQCWQFFDDFALINEHFAFFLYMEARKYDLYTVTDIMLRRITRFFLPLVASQDYLELPLTDVTAFLSSNYIGVNTEAEVFMAALYWLDYDWENRKKYQVEVIRCVRFCFLPPYFLVSFNKPSQHRSYQIQRCIEDKEVYRMIEEALSASIWQLYDADAQQFATVQNINQPRRTWVYDKECKYHDKRSNPNMSNVSYPAFCEYLDFLQLHDPLHYETFEVVSQTVGPEVVAQVP